MVNVSAAVTITSNNPYHSTASCAHQIFDIPSQGNLNIFYSCDHFKEISKPLHGEWGNYSLSENYEEILKATNEQFDYASMILATYENPDLDLLNNILNITSLSQNEEALLQYRFYYRVADLQMAWTWINSFAPGNSDEADFKTLRLFDLDIIESGWEILSNEDILILKAIKDKGTNNSNFAIALLNNTSNYLDYFKDEIDMSEVVKSDDVRHIGDEAGYLGYLNIFPNPATNKAFIELVHNTGLPGQLEIYDASGRQILDYTVTIVAGGIELDIQHLNEGLYFVTLSDSENGFIKVGKLVKMKD